MSEIYLPGDVAARVKEAVEARRNRQEIVKALSHGKVSRRDLLRMGLFTGAGLLAPIRGLNPFVTSAYAAGSNSIPTGSPRSPMFGVQAFSQPMLRFDCLDKNPISSLTPEPLEQSNQTHQPVHEALGGGYGPIEGRPPGALWAHQGWNQMPPKVAVEVHTCGANTTRLPPGRRAQHNSGFMDSSGCAPRFHPALPDQDPKCLWTFNGTIPPKLMLGRYGEGILFRNITTCRPTSKTTMVSAGTRSRRTSTTGTTARRTTGSRARSSSRTSITTTTIRSWSRGSTRSTRTPPDIRCSSPDDSGGLNKVAGDWHETMSTHWFHDHMFSFTAQNV